MITDFHELFSDFLKKVHPEAEQKNISEDTIKECFDEFIKLYRNEFLKSLYKGMYEAVAEHRLWSDEFTVGLEKKWFRAFVACDAMSIIADEIMIIGFDGIAYPCDSIKYFTALGISGNISKNSLMDIYTSEYFSNIRNFNTDNSCSSCEQYSICKSGCIGQKIIANYTDSKNKVLTLKRCINSRDPKCMR